MKIASSQVALSNDYQREEVNERRVALARSAADGGGTGTAANVTINQVQLRQSRLEASMQSAVVSATEGEASSAAKAEQADVTDEMNGHYDKSLYMMKMILERMSGKKIELFDSASFNAKISDVETANAQAMQGPQGEGASPDDLMVVANYHYEKESNQLQFAGVIERENGQQTRFAMAVEFSQEYESLSLDIVRREELKDPLVLSFSTEPVKLSSEKFQFDIDSDGEKDDISLLEAGYGYLALDKNGDGVINSGNELFGAQSGNGFAELAQYDDNQDGYIDENDAIYKDLSIWIKNENQDTQVSLKDKGVGAIGLENVNSPYTIRDGDERLGIIQKSGYYLNEDGTPGLIQQLDYIV